ncbi:hypothetical protein CYMTET_36119 [Cymbomonas tetramitiformis]|uniref:Uncharacterized protein n=1 Tax=Cymbomonas tetramitiformis TaxID=36881 RepID=A0AAE0CI01_9CHLO|nr:hypothetical protein CYMTET_36119 [Cymbomonas tetramitiformis]
MLRCLWGRLLSPPGGTEGWQEGRRAGGALEHGRALERGERARGAHTPEIDGSGDAPEYGHGPVERLVRPPSEPVAYFPGGRGPDWQPGAAEAALEASPDASPEHRLRSASMLSSTFLPETPRFGGPMGPAGRVLQPGPPPIFHLPPQRGGSDWGMMDDSERMPPPPDRPVPVPMLPRDPTNQRHLQVDGAPPAPEGSMPRSRASEQREHAAHELLAEAASALATATMQARHSERPSAASGLIRPSIMEGPSDASARQTGEPPAGGPAIGGRQSSRSAADGFWWKAPVGSSPASRGPPSARSSQLGHADAVNGWERAPARELALNSLSPGYVASSSAGAYSEMDGTDWVMEVEQRLSNSQFSLPSSTAAAGCAGYRPDRCLSSSFSPKHPHLPPLMECETLLPDDR